MGGGWVCWKSQISPTTFSTLHEEGIQCRSGWLPQKDQFWKPSSRKTFQTFIALLVWRFQGITKQNRRILIAFQRGSRQDLLTSISTWKIRGQREATMKWKELVKQELLASRAILPLELYPLLSKQIIVMLSKTSLLKFHHSRCIGMYHNILNKAHIFRVKGKFNGIWFIILNI